MRRTLRGVIAVCALLIFAFSALQVLDYWQEGEANSAVTETLIEEAVTETPPAEPAEKAEEILTDSVPINVDFEALWEENEDIVAWIYSPDTPLNNPIVQSEDNDYYLRRLLNGEYNEGGTLFLDYRNQADFSDWNSVVYGHNMKNGSMLGSIINYRRADYYEEHPFFWLLTPESSYKAEVLAGFVTDAYSDIYALPMDKERKEALVRTALSQSAFVSETEYSSEDKLLMLSTCSYDTEDSRFVLLAVLRDIND